MLTDDMTRLRDEIVAMRECRGGMMNDLQNGAKERKKAVTELCSHIGHARAPDGETDQEGPFGIPEQPASARLPRNAER